MVLVIGTGVISVGVGPGLTSSAWETPGSLGCPDKMVIDHLGGERNLVSGTSSRCPPGDGSNRSGSPGPRKGVFATARPSYRDALYSVAEVPKCAPDQADTDRYKYLKSLVFWSRKLREKVQLFHTYNITAKYYLVKSVFLIIYPRIDKFYLSIKRTIKWPFLSSSYCIFTLRQH